MGVDGKLDFFMSWVLPVIAIILAVIAVVIQKC